MWPAPVGTRARRPRRQPPMALQNVVMRSHAKLYEVTRGHTNNCQPVTSLTHWCLDMATYRIRIICSHIQSRPVKPSHFIGVCSCRLIISFSRRRPMYSTKHSRAGAAYRSPTCIARHSPAACRGGWSASTHLWMCRPVPGELSPRRWRSTELNRSLAFDSLPGPGKLSILDLHIGNDRSAVQSPHPNHRGCEITEKSIAQSACPASGQPIILLLMDQRF